MALDGLGNDALRSVIDIKNNVKETQGEVRSLNSEFKKLGLETININSAFSALNSSANKFAEIQKSSTKTSKSTADAVKEQNKQQNIAREISIQIENINKRLLAVSGKKSEEALKEQKILVRQADALSNAKVNAEGLATSFGQLAQDAASIDRKTEFFTGLSEVAKDIPGLRKLSGPFQEAAKAARETVLSNAKSSDITSRIGKLSKKELETGKGLSHERLKQMGLQDITGKKAGTNAATALNKAVSENKTRSVGLAGLKGGFKALGPLIRTAFGPIGLIFAAVSAVKAIISAMFAASAETAKFQRDLMVGAEQAKIIRDNTFYIAKHAMKYADTQGKVLILHKSIIEQLGKANKALGVAMDLTMDLGREFGGQLLAGSALLAENFGLTEAAIGEIQKESVVTGKDVTTIAQEMSGVVAVTALQKGLMVDVNEVMEETSKTSGELRLNFKNSNKEIARGITSLKLMGMNLTQLKGSSSSLLDFESSIAAEMEAELLTGRELNLEGARRAALDGDLVKLGEELNKQGIDYNELEEMNVLQRQAYAKAVGLSVDELADALKKQEEYNALQQRALTMGVRIADVENKSLKEIYTENKGIIGTEEEMIKLLGKRIYEQKLTEDAQAKFNKVLEKAKDIFASFISSGALDKLASYATSLVERGATSTLLGGGAEEQMAKEALTKAGYTVDEGGGFLGSGAFKSTEVYDKDGNQLDYAIGSQGVQGLAESILGENYNNPINADDALIRPGKRPIKFNKNDLIVAGTNLGGGSSDNGEIVMLLKEILGATKSGGDVYIERNKIGKVLDMDNPKMGISI